MEKFSSHWSAAARWATIASWGGRCVAAGLGLLVVHAVGGHLGVHGLALFVVIIGLVPWFQLIDGGFALAIQNEVAGAKARSQDATPAIAATTGWTLALALLAVPLWWVAAPWVAPHLFPADAEQGTDAGVTALRWAGMLILVTCLMGIPMRILNAVGRGWIPAVVGALACLVGWLLVRWAIAHQADLSVVLLAWLLPSTVAGLAAWCWAAWRWGVRIQLPKPLRAAALRFWIVAILGTVTLSMDYIVLSRLNLPTETVIYGVLQRVILFAAGLYAAALVASAPDITAGFARGDHALVWRQVHARLVPGLMAGALGGAALVVLGPWLVEWLSHGEARSSMLANACAGAYLLLRVWSDTFATALQSIGRMRVMIFMIPVQAAASVIGMVLLAPVWGAAGIYLGLIASFLLTSVWILPLTLRSAIGRIGSEPVRHP
jgi:O-antigen/teichoic acid export membrane protein